jgi:hypothetical protein
MPGDPRDTGAYRIAVCAVGLALVVVLAGLCVIVAVDPGEEIPKELWAITSALGGGLLGLLAPPPTPSSAPETAQAPTIPKKMTRSLKILAKDAAANRSALILLLVFAAAATLGAINESGQFQALAAASGGALIGLLAPTPGSKQVD